MLSSKIQMLSPILLETCSITSYQPIYPKENLSKKEFKETNENAVISDKNKNGNNVFYISGDSMIKHVNGRNVSASMNVK